MFRENAAENKGSRPTKEEGDCGAREGGTKESENASEVEEGRGNKILWLGSGCGFGELNDGTYELVRFNFEPALRCYISPIC